MPAKFHERFGIELGVEEGKRRFVNRSFNFIFDDVSLLAIQLDRTNGISSLANFICSTLGERNRQLLYVQDLIGEDFWKCLTVLEALSNSSVMKMREFANR